MNLFNTFFQCRNRSSARARSARAGARRPGLYAEPLEDRSVPAAAVPDVAVPTADGSPAWASTPTAAGGYTPDQIRQAYSISGTTFDGVVGNGSGQTIAIIDAYNDPDITSDLAAFDAQLGTTANGLNARSVSSFFSVVNQSGGSTPPSNAAPGATSWSVEESIDVEWAHAIAPGANIILVECNSSNSSDLISGGVAWARSQPEVSVISMSFAGTEGPVAGTDYTQANEATYDPIFTSPSGHNVTFVASAGDTGAPGGYPALSPNVLAVGGTSLTLNSQGNYSSETAWSSTGGGVSQYEARPSYQNGVAGVVGSHRGIPDVSFDANPNTGFVIYDSYDGSTSSPWAEYGGTSVSAPCWAGIVAIADQARVQSGQEAFDGASQLLPALYTSVPSAAFHDVTTGGNGTYNAGSGYDLVTGLGTPVVSQLINDLVPPVPAIVAQVTVGSTTYELNSVGNLYQEGSGSPVLLATQITQIAATSSQLFVLNSGDSVYLYQAGGGFGNSIASSVFQIAATSSQFFVLNAGDSVYLYQGGGFGTPIATQVYQIAATSSQFFVRNAGDGVYLYQAGGGFGTPIATQVTQMVATQNQLFVLNSGDSVYLYQGGGFGTPIATQVTQMVATQNQLFVLNTGDSVYLYQGGGFGTPIATQITQIAEAQGQLYVLQSGGNLFSFTGSGFNLLPSPVTAPTTVTTLVAPIGDTIYVLGTDGKVYRYNFMTSTWTVYATNVTHLGLTASGQLQTS